MGFAGQDPVAREPLTCEAQVPTLWYGVFLPTSAGGDHDELCCIYSQYRDAPPGPPY